MAIQFARMEYVSRTGGGNACLKSAYNKRDQIKDQRNLIRYSFGTRGGNAHHEVLLPMGASEKFFDSSVLWNTVEMFENRKNSQLAKEIVLALPDEGEITLEDRIELCRRFAVQNFTDKGLAVQMDIHAPHHEKDKNWHAHLLITTRRFSPDGEGLDRKKARDLDASVRKGFVVEGERWGAIWRDIQNGYFKEKGWDLRVDPIGVIAQEHLGPVRMRHHMSEVVARGEGLRVANQEASLNPRDILEHVTRTQSVFRNHDLDTYLEKHVPVFQRDNLRGEILGHHDLVSLYDPNTGEETGLYTTKWVRAEEEQIKRLAERVHGHKRMNEVSCLPPNVDVLSEEQKTALAHCVGAGSGLRVVQGRAGTGKSTVMSHVRTAYVSAGVPVMGLAPTHTVVRDMVTAGFEDAQTIHSFLFRYKNDRMTVASGTVLLVDEAGMVGTPALGELLKVAHARQCTMILMGDDRQLSSVERGGFFKIIAETFGSVELQTVHRQEVAWQRRVSEDLSQGRMEAAVHALNENRAIHWSMGKPEALSFLVEDYSRSCLLDPLKIGLILAHTNTEVDTLNQAVQQVRQALGQVSTREYVISTYRGQVAFAVGDRVQCMITDTSLGIRNGDVGILVDASKDQLVIQKESGVLLTLNSSIYSGMRLGYASTIYKGQGKTVAEAYVLHSPHMTENMSYVALTRQVKSVQLYVSQGETPNLDALVTQMSRPENRVVSVNFMTGKDLFHQRIKHQSYLSQLVYDVRDRVTQVVQRVTDRLPNASFYHAPASFKPQGAEVMEQNATDRWKRFSEKSVSPTVSEGVSKSADPKAQDFGRSSLSPHIERVYKEELIAMYREKAGEGSLGRYMERIDQTAMRATEYAVVRGMPETQEMRRVELARAHYECVRLSELKNTLTQERGSSWMERHLKSELLTIIEGKLYGILRSQKPLVTAEDRHLIREEAPYHLKDYRTLVDQYSLDAEKNHSYSKTKARFVGEQHALFKTRFGCRPNSAQLKAIQTAAEYGYDQYEAYRARESQLKGISDKGGEPTFRHIDHVAHYKARLETHAVLLRLLNAPEVGLPSFKELLRLQDRIEQAFQRDQAIENRRDKSLSKQQEAGVQTQAQKNHDLS